MCVRVYSFARVRAWALTNPALPAQVRAIVCLPTTAATFVCMCCAISGGHMYLHERTEMQQFLVALALKRAQREHAVDVERRRAAVESSARFERSFAYVCACACGVLCVCARARACVEVRVQFACECRTS